MRYLTIIPDYTSSCIRDEFGKPIPIKELGLPRDYAEELTSWHEAYRTIIPLSEVQRKSKRAEIKELDKRGVELAKKLQGVISGGAKVKYFSEGLLKHLPLNLRKA